MLCSQLKKDLVVYSFKVFLVVRNYSEIWKKVFIIKLEGIEVINQRYYSHKNPIDKSSCVIWNHINSMYKNNRYYHWSPFELHAMFFMASSVDWCGKEMKNKPKKDRQMDIKCWELVVWALRWRGCSSLELSMFIT